MSFELQGSLDISTKDSFLSEICDLLNSDMKYLAVLCKNLDEISSVGSGLLAALLKTLKSRGGDMLLVDVMEKTAEDFRLLGLHHAFPCVSGLEDALAEFNLREKIEENLLSEGLVCPHCGASLGFSPGNQFRCNECSAVFALDENGKIML